MHHATEKKKKGKQDQSSKEKVAVIAAGESIWNACLENSIENLAYSRFNRKDCKLAR